MSLRSMFTVTIFHCILYNQVNALEHYVPLHELTPKIPGCTSQFSYIEAQNAFNRPPIQQIPCTPDES